MTQTLRPDTVEEYLVGWTCPKCRHYNERPAVACGCGFRRPLDFRMDDELPDDDPQEHERE
jgi:hypothetical protein